MMMDYDKRKAYTDNQLKQAMTRLNFEQKVEFLRQSDHLLERESLIYLDVLTESRRLLASVLERLQCDDGSLGSADEQTDSNVNFPFNTATSMGKKLASIAQMFGANLNFSSATDVRAQDAIEKEQGDAEDVGTLNDTDTSSTANITNRKDKEAKPAMRESKQYLEVKTYLLEKMQADLENAAKDEQEIILAKMKTQGLQLASEYSRQQTLVSEKLEAAKEKSKTSRRDAAQVDTVNQMIDRNKEMADMHEKGRVEREQALKERLQQRKTQGSNEEDAIEKPTRGSKRKKKGGLPSADQEAPTESSTSSQQLEPKAETSVESENTEIRKRKKQRKKEQDNVAELSNSGN